MHTLEQHIANKLETQQISTCIVGCSAGLDSTVLLHLLHRLNQHVVIAHVNYGLRDNESNADETFLRELAQQLGISIYVHQSDLKKQLKSGGNLQEMAREERYTFFEKLLQEIPDARVFLGHHQEDQTETFFMNLARQSGVLGLAAMRETEGNFIRPLLNVSKDDLRAYAEANEIQWREDASNQTLKYTRNQWRLEILPKLRSELPNLDASIATLTQAFQEKQMDLETTSSSIQHLILERQWLPIKRYKSLDIHEKITLCRMLGQSPHLYKTWDKLKLKGTQIILQKNPNCPFDRIVLDEDRFTFLTDEKPTLPTFKITEVEQLPSVFEKETLYLPANLDFSQLTVRYPETGDRMQPIGLSGSKLVSDIIKDAKINAHEKWTQTVVCFNGKIIWVPNLCIGKMAEKAKNAARIVEIRLISAKSPE